MNRRSQLIIIICAVVSLTAIVSHCIIAFLGIGTTHGSHWVAGPGKHEPSVFMAGSSLAAEGLSWRRIGDVLNLRIEGWGVAGSSPSEWEQFQDRATHANLTVLVISPYDLNEYFLCDFRGEVVPLTQTITDLWQSRKDWPFCKRLLSLHMVTYLRGLFPTLGRSDGVMAGVREKLTRIAGAVSPIDSEARPKLPFNQAASAQEEFIKERVSDWSEGKVLRRLTAMRGVFQGKHTFDGPKRLAFARMLRKALRQGRAIVVVLPVSPLYSREFLTSEAKREFENSLAGLQHSAPQSHWIRLDQIDELNSNDYFWDLVHMNLYGQQIATKAFLAQFEKLSSLQ